MQDSSKTRAFGLFHSDHFVREFISSGLKDSYETLVIESPDDPLLGQLDQFDFGAMLLEEPFLDFPAVLTALDEYLTSAASSGSKPLTLFVLQGPESSNLEAQRGVSSTQLLEDLGHYQLKVYLIQAPLQPFDFIEDLEQYLNPVRLQ